VRASVLLTASVVASITFLPSPADAQARTARPRAVVPARSVVVSRPTVFVGGYYYPSFYRASLFYDPWYPGYYGFYGPAYYQYPIYGRGYYGQSGSVRLQVSPQQAEVFVDGYFAGTVDDFDGVFQRLHIEPGEHEVQVYLAGYRPFSQRFYLQPGRSFNIRHTLQPLAPGEAAPPRPDPAPQSGPAPYFGDPAADGRGAGAGRGGRGEPPGARGGGARGRQNGPAQGFGSLSLRVQPADAEVLIDGEPWQGSQGAEPLVVQLGAGTHHVEIRKEGYRTYLTDIPLGNGQVRTLNVSLTKQ
jgi:hypothetical protein